MRAYLDHGHIAVVVVLGEQHNEAGWGTSFSYRTLPGTLAALHTLYLDT